MIPSPFGFAPVGPGRLFLRTLLGMGIGSAVVLVVAANIARQQRKRGGNWNTVGDNNQGGGGDDYDPYAAAFEAGLNGDDNRDGDMPPADEPKPQE